MYEKTARTYKHAKIHVRMLLRVPVYIVCMFNAALSLSLPLSPSGTYSMEFITRLSSQHLQLGSLLSTSRFGELGTTTT